MAKIKVNQDRVTKDFGRERYIIYIIRMQNVPHMCEKRAGRSSGVD